MKTCEECSSPAFVSSLCRRHFEIAKRDLFRDEKPEVNNVVQMQEVQETTENSEEHKAWLWPDLQTEA